jgi:hypothetical protein
MLPPVIAIALACSLVSCSGRPETAPPAATPTFGDEEIVATDPPDGLLGILTQHDTTTWVRRFLPEKASSGFNLILYLRRLPILLDMNGNVVHKWPTVRAVSRARLNREGRLLVIARGNRGRRNG